MLSKLKIIVTTVMILLIVHAEAAEQSLSHPFNATNDQTELLNPVSIDTVDQTTDGVLYSESHSNLPIVENTESANVPSPDILLGNSATDQCLGQCVDAADRLWMISTRHLAQHVCNANLTSVDFRVSQLDRCGNRQSEQFESFLSSVTPGRTVVIHVHGNRLTEAEANARGRFIYRQIKPRISDMPIDFVIFSWPSEQRGLLIRDGREKAGITETESLYFATLLRELVARDVPVAIVAYSFGCRVVSGGLHCLAGGAVSGRRLPTAAIVGANVSVGMVAPAVQADWLGRGNYHGLATQNINDLAILYNSRDAILKRYWLVEFDSKMPALGYAGPRQIATGIDGLPVPLVKCDCARFLGLAHNEQEYYTDGCNAGRTMAALIRRTQGSN